MTLRPAELIAPVVAVAAAIAITSTMDANGLMNFSALPLLALIGAFWAWRRFPRQELGLRWGGRSGYALAVLHPVIVIGALTLIVAAAGLIHAGSTNWTKAILNLVLISAVTFLIAVLTEDGFFRGWLWAALRGAGVSPAATLIATSVAFALWHISAVTLPTGYNPPPAQVPVFLANAAVIGVIWGLIRWTSGSVIASSACHGLWNACAYGLFGYGAKVGALGVTNTALFGPEVGLMGLALNAAFAVGLLLSGRRRRLRVSAVEPQDSRAGKGV